jgi:hypothetical protein
MVADCWQCGTSIELTLEQEQAWQRLVEQRERNRPAAAPAARGEPNVVREKPAAPVAPQAAPPAAAPRRVAAAAALAPPAIRNRAHPDVAPPVRIPPKLPPRIPPVRRIAAVAKLPSRALRGTLRLLWHEILVRTPFWLISAAVHTVLLLALAIGMSDSVQEAFSPSIRLSDYVNPEHIGEGMNFDYDTPTHIDVFDPATIPPQSKEQLRAQSDAAELATTAADTSALPGLAQVVAAVNASDNNKMFQGRDPRLRNQMIAKEGGTTSTEAAVARGLRWFKLHQHEDGHWNLNDFQHVGDCNGRCTGQGPSSPIGATALALLPFLGAGQTHQTGIYRDEVERGLKWLVSQQKPSGDLRDPGVGRMYAHAQATIVLCEAYAISHDAAYFQAAQNALDFIVKAQNRVGGWRYEPGEDPGDLSVVGWQLMALRSGKMAGLNVPDRTLERTSLFLNSVQSDRVGGRYSYLPNQRNPSLAMTAEGLLCREYLGWPRTEAGLQAGVEILSENLPKKKDPNIYYWYYGTQVLHHLGGEPWEKWNSAMRDALTQTQETVGHAAGSWTPRGGVPGGHDVNTGGRIYVTSLAVCTLEVYYRHLPLYRGILIQDPTKKRAP